MIETYGSGCSSVRRTFKMWTAKLFYAIMISSMLSNSRGEKQGNGLCDVSEWYSGFVEHIDSSGIDLNGWQASSLRKIRYLVAEYDGRKVMKPCTLLDKFKSYILEENDEDDVDFNEIDVTDYKPIDLTANAATDNMLKENIGIQNASNSVDENRDGFAISDDHSDLSQTIGDDEVGEILKEERDIPSQQNEDNWNRHMDIIDPTDLSFLDFEDEDGDGDDAPTQDVDLRDSSDTDGSHRLTSDTLSHEIHMDGHPEDVDISSERELRDKGAFGEQERDEKHRNGRRDPVNSGNENNIESLDPPLMKDLDNSSDKNDNKRANRSLNVEHVDEGQDNKTNDGKYIQHNALMETNMVNENGVCAHNKCKNVYCIGLQKSRNTRQSAAVQSKRYTALEIPDKRKSDTKTSFGDGDDQENREAREESGLEHDIEGTESNEQREENIIGSKMEHSKTQNMTLASNDESKDDTDNDQNKNVVEVERENEQEQEESTQNTENVHVKSEQEDKNQPEYADSEENDQAKVELDDHNKGEQEEFVEHEPRERVDMEQDQYERELRQEKVNERVELSVEDENKENARYDSANEKIKEENVGRNVETAPEAGHQDKGNEHPRNRASNENTPLSNSNDIKIPDIPSLLAQQEQHTTHKIDELKLNLVTLENKFLMQSLNAKDDMISTQHIENHILKLENNLYKLNQSYSQLQRDHRMLKRKQKVQDINLLQYHETLKSCPTTQPKTENNLQLITQQKSRIWELSQVVANQSLNIQQMQSRSSFLEEQNRQLFKVVMDQSALISNILSQVQDMGENNAKTRLETIELKVLFERALATSNKREESRVSGANEDQVGRASMEALPDSAFIPLGNAESNGGKEISFEKLEEKVKQQSSTENQLGIRTPFVREDIKDDIDNHDSTLPAETENVHLSSDGINNIKPTDVDTPGAKRSEFDSTNSTPPTTANVEDKTGRSENVEREKQAKKKMDAQKHQAHQILYPTPHLDKPTDCFDLYKKKAAGSGMNKVYVAGLDLSVNVHCDAIGGSGGWTVILRRDGGREDFYKNFEQYREGFGSPRSEHYLGNEVIHYLTNQKHYTLRVDLTDWEENTRHAVYDQFWLGGEDEHFRLNVHGYSGTAGDGLSKHNGMKFSTFDVDNDLLKKEMGGSCAKRFKGAGWYYKCYQSNLMGVFYNDGIIPEKRYDGITWKPWMGPNYSMKSVTMSIRPRDEE